MLTKPFLDAIVVEDIEGNRRFPDSSGTDESDGLEALRKTDNPLNQLFAAKTGPRRWGRYFSDGYTNLSLRNGERFVVVG